ncbi:hypothetical protein BGZ80_002782 [Entomortierella chlamydospora]|uniref:HotDog ACOT-type domain-containing protein n=1 Tax=Entomortierella chlamydospora TaxID=101097 RepID=A0A9P6N147_9FUNG|nr:hypothetical protein BGZ80_002782 [Entomortierella chlamydospora]
MFISRTNRTPKSLLARSVTKKLFSLSAHGVAPEATSSTLISSSATPVPVSLPAKGLSEKVKKGPLDKLHSNCSGKIIATPGGPARFISPTADFLPSDNKVFTVRPVTSWIDKLASKHGSPASHFGNIDTTKKYQKRELIQKSMQDSYTEIIMPFKSDKTLLEEYINEGGTLRNGKIMEDLDAMAGAIAYKHADDGKPDSSPLTMVTASVDRIDLLKPLGVADIRLCGHVSYVGNSSMEIFMKMEEINSEAPEKPGDTILVARFTMVARDTITGKAAQVNPILLKNDTEKTLFQIGDDHKARKRLASDASLTRFPPTQEERVLIHDLYLEYTEYENPQSKIKKPSNVEWMSDTKMSAVHIMQPQDRNIHDKAVYSEGGDQRSFQVMVQADILDLHKRTRETTNTFWFTFSDPVNATPRIMPKTYAESMLYIEGRRRKLIGNHMAGVSKKLSLT